MNETRNPPPAWMLEPIAAWVFLAVQIGLVFTPVYPLNWALAIAAAVVVYKERRAHEFPVFWWTAAVVVFGSLAYFFLYIASNVVFAPQEAKGVPDPTGIARALLGRLGLDRPHVRLTSPTSALAAPPRPSGRRRSRTGRR